VEVSERESWDQARRKELVDIVGIMILDCKAKRVSDEHDKITLLK
jgi:hypothetical protein